MRTTILALFLGALWFGMSGHTEPLIIGFGVVGCVGVALIARRMGVVDSEGFPYQIAIRATLYTFWLGIQILLSSLAVARVILRPSLPISPRWIRQASTQSNDLGLVIYANSITATPGTICVNVEPGSVVVHALTAPAASDLASGEMDRRVKDVVGSGG